jgi:DNA-binding NarL/FixJ family response regulator
MLPLRIFVADEHDLVRHGIIATVAAHRDWEVCGEAADGLQAVAEADRLHPDIVLLDVALPRLNGVEATRQIMQSNPLQRILLLSLTDVEEVVRESLRAGARGFLLKSDTGPHLVAAVEALEEGRTFYTSQVAELIVKGYLKGGNDHGREAQLSAEEREAERRLCEELAASIGHHRGFRRWLDRSAKFAFLGVVATLVLALGWSAFHPRQDPLKPAVNKLLLGLKLKTPEPAVYEGNPDAKVWVDLHTAVYYCRGTPQYGRTGKGRFARQHDAQLDHFEAASHHPCD